MIAGVGIDVVHVERVQDLLRAKGDRALRRLFTDGEQRYCATKAHPERHYAVRLAAKEAAFKALSGTDDARGIGWREIEVRTGTHGRPELLLHGRAARRAAELQVASLWISLTHDHTTAAAVVVLEVRGA
jgi:holo-[acyl-carrier protein] synthase